MDGEDLLARLPRAKEIFSAEELEKIATALRLAESVHRGQTRDEGTPYIEHPIAVARILMEEIDITESGVSPLDAICAALLHDVLEDSELTAKELEQDVAPGISGETAWLLARNGGVVLAAGRDHRSLSLRNPPGSVHLAPPGDGDRRVTAQTMRAAFPAPPRRDRPG
jgi:hypothetical protein